jgi:dTDP-L-rhamnose 4-epimerase
VKVLITGGAGFIGSHLTDRLVAMGATVRILDNLEPQVHGEGARKQKARPEYLHKQAELLVGDVRDKQAVLAALDSVDAVFHFAARVGVGQSMYEIANYTAVNTVGTGVLLEALVDRPVKRLIVASSMSIYGEGRCVARDGRIVEPPDRARAQLERGEWELLDESGDRLTPLPTTEAKSPSLASVYALSKYDQERLCLIFGSTYRVKTVALRFFNVYGTRQALSNPYTGVLAIFAARLLNNKAPVIFEDGLQRRDFVSVHDVVRACIRALEAEKAPGNAFNVGSGWSVTVRDVAAALARALKKEHITPEISGKYRAGDIRHCFADISLAREKLDYEPAVDFEDGLRELAEWLKGQQAEDRVEAATSELTRRGLTL